MYRLVSKLLLYGNVGSDPVLKELCGICREVDAQNGDREELIRRIYRQVRTVLEVSTKYGFDKNLWHNYLTYLLLMDENPFSVTCEKIGVKDGTVNRFALNDFKVFLELFHYDFGKLEAYLGIDCFSCLNDYRAIQKPELMYNKNVSDKVRELSERLETAADEKEFFTCVTDFYRAYGVGLLGMNKAFRIREREDNEVEFLPINNMDKVVLDDLVGYEIQKQKLVDNTKAFVEGRKANNVLLYGDSGTGKSTSIKAIVNEFYGSGLRMIEIYKYQFKDLSKIIAQIKNRNYKFIIYMDDLSFEEFETDYKYLKAVIEGGLEKKPENVLIYATSNRRHLIRENYADKEGDIRSDMHTSDTVQEKLSLAYRFGVTIYFGAPVKKEFQQILEVLAQRNGIDMPLEQLYLEANAWELSHGGRSGRTAQQFIDHLLGKDPEEKNEEGTH